MRARGIAVHSPNGGTPKGDCENHESAIVEVGLQVLFRPKGASTNQPRAERSAALGLNCRTDSSPERAIQIQEFSQLLFRPFRAKEDLNAIIESWPLCLTDPGSMELRRAQQGPSSERMRPR